MVDCYERDTYQILLQWGAQRELLTDHTMKLESLAMTSHLNS